LYDETNPREKVIGLMSEAKDSSAQQSRYEKYVNPQWVRLLDVLGAIREELDRNAISGTWPWSIAGSGNSHSRRPVRRIVIALVGAIALAFAGLTGFAFSAESREGVVTLDPSKTLVEFRLGGAFHTTHGQFQLKGGTIKADSATGRAEGTIVVDAASGDSGDSLRDIRMKDAVLEAEKYPEITFKPLHIYGHLDPAGGFQARLDGLLKLHGVEHDITIDTHGTLIGDSLVATGHFSVPYLEWGLKDPSILFLTVAKHVDIDIATAGRITWLGGEKAATHRP
jgi:polyisoprenoid-binding protein YceI